MAWQIERYNNKLMEYYRDTFRNSRRLLSGLNNLDDKHLVIYCEQGAGDAIQLLRYIPLLPTKHITICCVSALHRLIQSQWNVSVMDKFDPNLPDHDYHILSMDLPILFGRIPPSPYIFIDEVMPDTLTYQNRIGISWEGNPNNPLNKRRSCPLAYFKQLEGTLFCLQPQTYLKELLVGCEDMTLLAEPISDFYDTAKMINSMDKIVTVDTSILHLAGAMGKETYGLLSKPCDPRWGKRSDTTLWYQSVRLLRQKSRGDWESVFDLVFKA